MKTLLWIGLPELPDSADTERFGTSTSYATRGVSQVEKVALASTLLLAGSVSHGRVNRDYHAIDKTVAQAILERVS